MDSSHCPGCLERDGRIATLEAKVAELEAQIRDLTKPPTKPRVPAVFVKAPAKKPTGKKPGGHRATNKEELYELTEEKLENMSDDRDLLQGLYFRCCVAELLR